MSQQQVSVMSLIALTLLGSGALAGSLDSPAAPSDAGSAMYTLEDIYNRLNDGTAGAKRAGAFTEPPAPPGSSGHTLDEVMARAPATNAGAATAEDVLTGGVYWGLDSGQWGTHTGSMAVAALSDTNDVVQAGYYAATNLTSVDPDLVGANVRSGMIIFGVSGDSNVVDTSSGDATAADILNAKRAWVGGSEVTGTVAVLTFSDSAPAVSAGYYAATNLAQVDGDLATANIATNVTILGITGALSENGGAYHCPYPAMLPMTGQTSSYRAEDDGDLRKGVPWPSPRFTDHGDGTVTDNLTGLMWTQNADIWGNVTWNSAVDNCAGYSLAGHSDWRLPNVCELKSLLDYSQYDDALPSGHPFYDVQGIVWSSTTVGWGGGSWAVMVSFQTGSSSASSKTSGFRVWPVRGGE